MRRNNLFAKFIITFTLAAFLTMSVGKVQRTYALATTAVIAGAALLGTGAIYLGYLALTGANVSIPHGTGQEIQDYLTDVGRKVAYYGSGAFIYQKLYSYLRSDGIAALNSYDVTLTQDDLKSLYNDFKDISINQGIQSFVDYLDFIPPALPFDYPFTIQTYSPSQVNVYPDGDIYSISDFSTNHLIVYPSGPRVYVSVYSSYRYALNMFDTSRIWRNYYDGSYYYVQYLNGDTWVNFNSNMDFSARVYDLNENPSANAYLNPYRPDVWRNTPVVQSIFVYRETYPMLIDSPLYDATTGETVEVIPREDTEVITSPYYEDNDYYPVVPYVQLPSGGNWGFNLGDLITDIVNRAGQIVTASWIGSLINQFMNSLGGDTGDYIYYSDNVNNYYIYYSNVYQGDDYTTYNIDVSDQGDVIPVDLNTIEQFTNNQYLDVVKERVNAFSDTVGSFVAFWHNTDFEIVYAVFGSALIVLLGAFIGKWGHS